MFRRQVFKRFYVPALALAAAFAFVIPTYRSIASEVRDGAHQFDSATLDQVNSIVKQIKEKHGKDLTIATFETIPDNQKARFSASTKDDFYEHWLRQEARQSETNGVFILIVKDPGRLQVGVGNATRNKAFTDRDRDELREVMLTKFREKQFNEGLVDGAKFVLERMDKNSGMGNSTTTPPASNPTSVMPATQPTTNPSPDAAPKTEPAEKSDSSKPTPPAQSGTDVKPAEGAAPDAGAKPESSPKTEADKAQSSLKADSDVKSSTPGSVESGK